MNPKCSGVRFEEGSNMRMAIGIAGLLLASFALPAAAQEVQIADGVPQVSFTVNGRNFTIARDQDQNANLTGEFAKTSRPCPAFCVQPMIAAPGVQPVGELELISFLENVVAEGSGLLIDARLPDWYAKGAIPGAVNVPFAALDAQNPYKNDILLALGAVQTSDGMDFTTANDLMVYGNGAWDEQGSRAITNLIDAGYPASKIQNYRGGLEDWLHLGLSTLVP